MLSGQVGDAAGWGLTTDSGAWSVVWASYSAQQAARTVAARQVRHPAGTAASTPQRLRSDLQASAVEQPQRLLIMDTAPIDGKWGHTWQYLSNSGKIGKAFLRNTNALFGQHGKYQGMFG